MLEVSMRARGPSKWTLRVFGVAFKLPHKNSTNGTTTAMSTMAPHTPNQAQGLVFGGGEGRVFISNVVRGKGEKRNDLKNAFLCNQHCNLFQISVTSPEVSLLSVCWAKCALGKLCIMQGGLRFG